MHYVLANIDRWEYIRPVALGAAQGSKFESLACTASCHGAEWMSYVCRLLEHGGKQALVYGKDAPFPFESWAADRIALIRSDDTSFDLLFDEDVEALAALAGQRLTTYDYVRQHFTDVTKTLQDFCPRHSWMEDVRFASITRPEDYGWLTPDHATRLVRMVQARSPKLLMNYIEWLLERPGLSVYVESMLRQGLQKLNSATL